MLNVMDHEKCREKVCVVCSKKASRKLSKTLISAVKIHVDPQFNEKTPDYPTGICTSCQILLNKKNNGQDVELSINQKYKPFRFLRSSSAVSCTCPICEIAKSCGLKFANSKKKPGRPKTIQPAPTTLQVCSRCFHEIYRGSQHQCSNESYRRNKVYNLEHLITPTTSERIASRVMNKCRDDTALSTLGSRKRSIATEPTKKVLFSSDDMIAIRKDGNFSSRQTINIMQNLNKAAGHRVFETSIKRTMYDKNHSLDSYFDHMTLQFTRIVKETKRTENFDQHVVVVNDFPGFIDKVLQVRNFDRNNCLIRIGMDGGGGFFKICSSVFNLLNRDETTPIKTLGKKFVDTGVKKIFIIAIAPATPENYFNLEKIWVAAGMNYLTWDYSSCTIASDLKLLNILLGLMSHSSLHPCCWCDTDKYHLHLKGNQRTLGSLNKMYREFRDAHVSSDKAKQFGNVVHPPLIQGDDATPVIHVIPPPELHLMLGPVNHLYDELSKSWSDSEQWLTSCNVKKTDYQGGQFEGNDCRKLLKNVHQLETLCPSEFSQFVETFTKFDEVVHSCYGNELLPNYDLRISEFMNEYMKLSISVTPKVHAVFYHIEEFCSLTKMGLGPWSEQASESVHQEFTKCWGKYKVKNTDHPMYGQKLLEAVQMFNGLNL